jgi:hypothetical protein
MTSYSTQFNTLVKSWNLTYTDVPIVKYLNSYRDYSYEIRQRLDTKQYIFLSMSNLYSDGVDDYFAWKYITEDEISSYK